MDAVRYSCALLAMILVAACGVAAPHGSTPLGARGLGAIDDDRIVDLTYTFDSRTVYWPTSTPFRLETVARGRRPQGYWYAANDFSAAEHGGTHLDAPNHFAEGEWAADEIPLGRLIGPAVVVDIRERARTDRDAELTIGDIARWEKQHGRIPRGAIVLLYSGWGERWPDRARYLGSDVPGDTDDLHFPGFGAAAAEFLVTERAVDAVGTDTASIDPGQSTDFMAHRVFGTAGVPALENLAALDQLPPSGATLLALPMKIGGGTGGPARVIAVLPPEDTERDAARRTWRRKNRSRQPYFKNRPVHPRRRCR
jgi:kynurenine formamidase